MHNIQVMFSCSNVSAPNGMGEGRTWCKRDIYTVIHMQMITIHLNSIITSLIFRYLNVVHSFWTFRCLFQLLWCCLIERHPLTHFLLLFCLLSLVKQRHTWVICYFELHISLPFLLQTIQKIISLKAQDIKNHVSSTSKHTVLGWT